MLREDGGHQKPEDTDLIPAPAPEDIRVCQAALILSIYAAVRHDSIKFLRGERKESSRWKLRTREKPESWIKFKLLLLDLPERWYICEV
jgi:hypothetical protein